MGQDSHRMYKEYKEKESIARRSNSSESDRKDAEIAHLRYKEQQMIDDKDFERGYDLLSRYEY